MANEQYAFLRTGNVPDRDGLQFAINHAGFNLKLDADYRPRTSALVLSPVRSTASLVALRCTSTIPRNF